MARTPHLLACASAGDHHETSRAKVIISVLCSDLGQGHPRNTWPWPEKSRQTLKELTAAGSQLISCSWAESCLSKQDLKAVSPCLLHLETRAGWLRCFRGLHNSPGAPRTRKSSPDPLPYKPDTILRGKAEEMRDYLRDLVFSTNGRLFLKRLYKWLYQTLICFSGNPVMRAQEND